MRRETSSTATTAHAKTDCASVDARQAPAGASPGEGEGQGREQSPPLFGKSAWAAPGREELMRGETSSTLLRLLCGRGVAFALVLVPCALAALFSLFAAGLLPSLWLPVWLLFGLGL